MIQVERVSGGYESRLIIEDVSFRIHKGEFFTLLGPNGSGKSTLLKMITGVLPYQSGQISFAGRPIRQYGARELAKNMAVLSQESQVTFDFTASEIVMLGRYPHQKGWFQGMTAKDEQSTEEAMRATSVWQHRDTPFHALSGGEKQRVLLAKSLAQEPQVLLLDEPTNHLDIRHTFDMLSLLKQWQATKGLTVLAILHDLNVASLYADRVALLNGGGIVEVGDVHLLKNKEQLESVYGVETNVQYHPRLPKPQLFLTPKHRAPNEGEPFEEAYKVEQTKKWIHIFFDAPLRTVSNGVNGEGLQWMSHFCNFHVDPDYDGADPQKEMREWLKEAGVPFEQTVGMMTAVNLEDAVFKYEKSERYAIFAMVTAGISNAVDITNNLQPNLASAPGTINMMLFINGHLTDGALVNAVISATEAKTKVLHDRQAIDPNSKTIATGTSTDSILIAATQKGEPTQYAGSGTELGKLIGKTVYQAAWKALENYAERISDSSV